VREIIRFDFETLAMGRIPLVIETDFRLPLEGTIKWKTLSYGE
jgi:hypothetical protein